jgi:hypothetical protein
MEKKFTPVLDALLKGHTNSKNVVTREARVVVVGNQGLNSSLTLENKLGKIKAMYKKGVISKKEYTLKRKQLLSDY